MLIKLWRKYGINPFDSLLRRAARSAQTRFLICWNRGLGDIPLGLYALSHRIREYIPEAQITFVTRSDLLDGFKLLEGVTAVVDPEWKRGIPFDLDKTLLNTGLHRTDFDVIIEKPDPTRWLRWQLGKLVPRLHWQSEWDALAQRFSLDPNKKYVGVHVQTETNYAYEKNWPLEYWEKCLKKIYSEHQALIILFGFAPHPPFEAEGIVDLRGKTSLFEMISIIKNHCNYLLVPDSGVLSIAYYLNTSFPIDISIPLGRSAAGRSQAECRFAKPTPPPPHTRRREQGLADSKRSSALAANFVCWERSMKTTKITEILLPNAGRHIS